MIDQIKLRIPRFLLLNWQRRIWKTVAAVLIRQHRELHLLQAVSQGALGVGAGPAPTRHSGRVPGVGGGGVGW